MERLEPSPHAALGWEVPDIEDTLRTLAAKGVVFERFDDLEQDKWGIWEAEDGSQMAWFKDPDGNLLLLAQS